MRSTKIFACAVLMISGLALSSTAFGQEQSWQFLEISNGGCADSEATMTTVFNNLTDPGDYTAYNTTEHGGLLYMNAIFASDSLNDIPPETTGWNIFADDTGGPTTGTFPIPEVGEVTHTFILINPDGEAIYESVAVLTSCNGQGVVQSITNTPLGSQAPGGGATAPVPTLGFWGITLLVLSLFGLSGMFLRRKNSVS